MADFETTIATRTAQREGPVSPRQAGVDAGLYEHPDSPPIACTLPESTLDPLTVPAWQRQKHKAHREGGLSA